MRASAIVIGGFAFSSAVAGAQGLLLAQRPRPILSSATINTLRTISSLGADCALASFVCAPMTSMTATSPRIGYGIRIRTPRGSCERSILRADRQFLGREQRDHAAALVGDHHLFLDARRGVAVGRRAVGLDCEHH